MKGFIVLVCSSVLFFSCSRDAAVRISGRMENGDSVVSIWLDDSIYTFPLDENDFFAGRIVLKHSGYATLLHNALNLYLSPGEDLEIYVNALNFSGSLYFRGSLGGVNSYLKEQEVAVFFDRDYYALDETGFVDKMKELIDEKIKLLEAKNFDDSFTNLEKERIRYSVAEKVSFYPIYQKRMYPERNYQPGKVFADFLSSFSLNDEELFGTKDYRSFLLNYVYLQGSRGYGTGESYSDGIADYILSTVKNPTIRNFLLTEIVYRHIWENNGLDGVDYLLSVFRRECTDRNKVAYINGMVSLWERLLPGRPAPDFTVEDTEGKAVALKDFRGSYLYIVVWATWCVPCKNELPYLDFLNRHCGKNVKFLTIAVDASDQELWKSFLKQHPYAGIHTAAGESSKFSEDYMIISVPRFILIDPEGKIVSSNAPRPSGQILQLFESLDL